VGATHPATSGDLSKATRLKGAGLPIGASELWIAYHALAEQATLVPHNIREFSRVSGLRLQDWAESIES
jgi:tRNA(fMet)-specific endonuclease VapC